MLPTSKSSTSGMFPSRHSYFDMSPVLKDVFQNNEFETRSTSLKNAWFLQDLKKYSHCDVHGVGQQSQEKKDVAWQRTRTQQWKELLFSLRSVPRQWKCIPYVSWGIQGSVKSLRRRDGSAGGPGPWRDSAETVQWNTG
jgi:hypothetical protein